MRKGLYLFMPLLVLLAVLFSGCSKDEDNTIAASDEKFDPYFSMKVDGVERQSKSISVINAPKSLNLLQIIGKSDIYSLDLALQEDQLKIGTLQLKDKNVFAYDIITTELAYITMYDFKGGTCTITKLTDKEIAGTFECYATDFETQTRVHITDGKFRVPRPQ